MGEVVRFPAKGKRAPGTNRTIVDLFNRLDPIEQLAIVKAAEIVIEARRQMPPADPPKE